MPDIPLVTDREFSHDPSLAEGEVALAFSSKGMRIIHNIPEVRETGVMIGPDAGLVMMALAAMELVNDEPPFVEAMKKAALMMEQINIPSPHALRN